MFIGSGNFRNNGVTQLLNLLITIHLIWETKILKSKLKNQKKFTRYKIRARKIANYKHLPPSYRNQKAQKKAIHYWTAFNLFVRFPLLTSGWSKGLEPSTLRTTIWCSNQLSYDHRLFGSAKINKFIFNFQIFSHFFA